MTALPLPTPSRDGNDDEKRAYLETIVTAELTLSSSAPAERAERDDARALSITAGDVADMPTLLAVPPRVEATVAYQLLRRAEWHEHEAARLRRYARDTRANVAQMQGILDEWEAEWLLLVGIAAARRTSWQQRRYDYLQERIPLIASDINRFAAGMMRAEREADEHEMSVVAIRRVLRRDDEHSSERNGQGR